MSSFAVGVVLDKFKNYKAMSMTLSIATAIFTLVLFYSIRQDDQPFIMTINLGFYGAAIIPMLTVAFPFAVELTRPIPESFSNGILITMGLLWGALLGIVAISIALDYAFIIFFISGVIAALLCFLIKEDLRR